MEVPRQVERSVSRLVCDELVMGLPADVLGAASKHAWSWLQTRCFEEHGTVTGVVEFAAAQLAGFFGRERQAAYDWLAGLEREGLVEKLPRRRKGVLRYQLLDSSECLLRHYDPGKLSDLPLFRALKETDETQAGERCGREDASIAGTLAPQASPPQGEPRPDQPPPAGVPKNTGGDGRVAPVCSTDGGGQGCRVFSGKPDSSNPAARLVGFSAENPTSLFTKEGKSTDLPITKDPNVTNGSNGKFGVNSDCRPRRVSSREPDRKPDEHLSRGERAVIADIQRRSAAIAERQRASDPQRLKVHAADVDRQQEAAFGEYCRTMGEAEQLISAIARRILSACPDLAPYAARRAGEAVVLGDGSARLPANAIDEVLADFDHYCRNDLIKSTPGAWLNGALQKRFAKHGVAWKRLRRPK